MQNLHTHSTFCDGKDSLEEIVVSAIANGFDSLGFSSHSYTPFDLSYCMKDEDGYIAECQRLREKYRDKIDILIGLERDLFSPLPSRKYDYIIGSVHYLKSGDEYIPVDESADILRDGAKKYFKGDTTKLACEYYRLVGSLIEKTGCDMIGHFDLITKFSEKCPDLIDMDDPKIIAAEAKALDTLISSGALFEVNTGAMARGYRTAPYPSERCLKRIKEKGGRVIISSDCHDKNGLDHGFEKAKSILKDCGFDSVYIFKNGRFVAEKI